jgi:Gpi18-like mannosyltransferase
MATATRVPGVALVPAFLFVAWRERRPAIAYATAIAVGTGLLLFSTYCAIRFGDPLAFIHAQQPIEQYPSRLIGIRRLINLVMIFGCGALLWRLSSQLSRVAVAYGFCSLTLLVTVRAVRSINRYLYGIVPLSIALGVLFARYPRWGYPTLGLFVIFLVVFSIRFSWNLWVA